MMELHLKQNSTKEPAIVAEGCLMYQCFSYMHSAAGFQRRKKVMITELKLHTVKALHPKLS